MNGPRRANRRTVLRTTAATLAGAGLVTGTAGATRETPPAKSRGRRNEIEIVAKHDHDADEHRFELDTREVASGWTTFEFDNRTDHIHFAYLPKLPQQALDDAETEGMDPLDFYVETVTRPFQYFLDSEVDGKQPDPDDNTEIYDSLFPPWFGDVVFYGGPGLTSGHERSTTTVDLDPGEYIVECYVKDDSNDFHSYLGMIDLLSVTDETSDASEPDSTLDLSVSTDGIDAPAAVRPGRHTVGIEFESQQQYKNLVGHDIHLIRLEDGTDVDAVNDWMNWADPGQFISNGDEPTTFLGGVSDIWTADLPKIGYFDVLLKPGDYAWVAEVPDPGSKGLLDAFSVPNKGPIRSLGGHGLRS
jgi:hypothetical protein